MNDHYFKDCPYSQIDVYRIIEIFGVTCPVAQHVLKKALCAGQRGHKDLVTDWANIRDSASRKLEMMAEDAKAKNAVDGDWICWLGGDLPACGPKGRVLVRRLGGDESSLVYEAGDLIWTRRGRESDIVAYKVVG